MSLHVNALLASTWNCTPMITPAGVAAVPWFLTVAANCTGPPAVAVGGVIPVTTRSGIAGGIGAAAEVVNGEVRMLLASLDSPMRLTSST